MAISRGMIQVYTGEGKGKTTAALGLALRAAGAGIKTVIIQFMKGRHSSERDSALMLGGLVVIENFGSEDFILNDTDISTHKKHVRAGLDRALEIFREQPCGILVLDEILSAMRFNLLSENELLDIMKAKPENMELVLTGRSATNRVIDAADLVTEMKCVKHYYNSGIKARRGIEE